MTPYTEEQIDDFRRQPAVSPSHIQPYCYFIKNGEIAGLGRYSSFSSGHAIVEIADDRARDLFRDTPEYATLKDIMPIRFWQHDGTPFPMFPELPDNRFDGITIVDKWQFDFGYHSKRYESIPGFGLRRIQEEQNIPEKQGE